MRFFAEVKGGEALRKALRRIPMEFLDKLATELPNEGERLKTEGNALAPSKSGALKASAAVSSHRGKSQVRVAVAYLDPKAAPVHEGIHWGRHIPGTKGFKWFARTKEAFERGFVSRIADALRGLLK